MRKIFSFSFAALLVLALSAFSVMAQSTTTGAIGGDRKGPARRSRRRVPR